MNYTPAPKLYSEIYELFFRWTRICNQKYFRKVMKSEREGWGKGENLS